MARWDGTQKAARGQKPAAEEHRANQLLLEDGERGRRGNVDPDTAVRAPREGGASGDHREGSGSAALRPLGTRAGRAGARTRAARARCRRACTRAATLKVVRDTSDGKPAGPWRPFLRCRLCGLSDGPLKFLQRLPPLLPSGTPRPVLSCKNYQGRT